jgi:hypothetical protein
MCRREGASLQQGMNFGLGGNHSVILMSVRPNAPYRDRLEDSGTTIVYEGHDMPKSASCPNPKVVDQPFKLGSGRTMACSTWSTRGPSETRFVPSANLGSSLSKERKTSNNQCT